MKGVNPLTLSLLVAPSCAGEVVSVFLAMEPPQRSVRGERPLVRSAAELDAMSNVVDSCSMDVMTLCSHDDDMFVSRGDPFLNWITTPTDLPPPPPPFLEGSNEIGDVLNRMMDVALNLAPPERVVQVTQPLAPKEEPVQLKEKPAERVFDTMVTSLAHHLSSESADEETPETVEAKESADENVPAPFDPVAFAKRVVEHGHEVLQSNVPEDRRHLARRLTLVEPYTFAKPRLPFGCHKSQCLWKAYTQGTLSQRCSSSLDNLQRLVQTRQARHEAAMRDVHRMEQQQDAFLLMVLVYGVLALATLVLLIRRFRKHFRSDRMRLKRRMIQAIYSNPAIKAAVEEELQEELGSVPPLPPRVLATMSAEGRRRMRTWRRCRIFRLAFFALLLWLAVVQPFVTMFLLCIMMGVRFFKLWCCPRKPIEDCTCCCCGGSTKDVREGTMSAAQECCTCCRGTGVCAPACNDCCGGQPCGCDCTNGCNCCDPPGCTCCCCGVSERDVRHGNVTAKQQCCNCCRGTGVCAPGCDACCHGKSCCCDCTDGCNCCGDSSCCSMTPPPGTRRRRYASKVAYEGVPVQVV